MENYTDYTAYLRRGDKTLIAKACRVSHTLVGEVVAMRRRNRYVEHAIICLAKKHIELEKATIKELIK